MVACKVILAVAVVFVAVVQIQGKPATDTDWATPMIDELRYLTSNISSIVGLDKTAEFTKTAQANLNTFSETLKKEADTFTKTFEGKTSVSDMFRDSTKHFQGAIDTYIKSFPKDGFTMKEFTDKTEQALKTMVEHGTEITKKAQGNVEIEKQIKEFIKKHVDSLMDQTKAYQAKFMETKKA